MGKLTIRGTLDIASMSVTNQQPHNAPVNIIPCPPRPGTSGALAGDSQHFVSIIGESGH